MKVETYEVEEISNELGVMAADAEAAELIEKLGLDGQRSLLHTETCTRFPYRKMSPVELKVFSSLFPVRQKLEEYRAGIVPIRVLQVAAFCKENAPDDMKGGLHVWHTGVAKEDPILVGHTSGYGGEFYLLARWGEALATMDEMMTKAKSAWIAKAQAKLRKEIADAQSDISNIEDIATGLFLTGKCETANQRYTLEAL